MVFSLPNLLTLFRLLVAPLFLFFYSGYISTNIALLLIALLVMAEVSDLLDGYLARKWGQVTDLGKILDPFADSLYRVTVLLSLTLPPVSLPVYLILIFFYRDSSISTLRTVVALKGVALHARLSGKIKAVLQGSTILAISVMLYFFSAGMMEQETLSSISTLLATGAALYTLFSGLEYFFSAKN
jgi:CDP-diacylglycerol--glycerol-3-phosphate 3-phosphatidyltransferase